MGQLFFETVVPGTGGFTSHAYGNIRANFSMHETAGVACTVTVQGPAGETIINVAANGTAIRQATSLNWFKVTGNGASLVLEVSGPVTNPVEALEYTDPKTLSAISTPVATNSTLVGDSVGLARSSQFTPIPFVSGDTPPGAGWVHFLLVGNGSAEPKVTIGSVAHGLNGGSPLASGVGLYGSIAVDGTATVTFSGAGITTLTFTSGVA